MNLSSWLRKTPQPHSIDVDGKKIAVPLGGGKWRDLVRTIESMKGTQISCLDAAGCIIRAITLDDDAPEEKKSEPKSDIQVFAHLIAEAYDKGHKAQQPVLDNQTSFIERLSARLALTERECDRLRQENLRLRGQVIEANALPAGDEEGGLLASVLTGAAHAAMAQQAQPVQARPNGKGKRP